MMLNPNGMNLTTIAAIFQFFALGFYLVGLLAFLYIPYVLYQLNKKNDALVKLLEEISRNTVSKH